MKRTRLKPISEKRGEALKREGLIRKQLCERAGGLFFWDGKQGVCLQGQCEECGQSPDWRGLRPHHTGIGASRKPLSLRDKMLCGKCHSAKHGIKELDLHIGERG